jgi:hypothetical protein
MSTSTASESCGEFVSQLLLNLDSEMTAEMNVKYKNTNEIYQRYFDRLSLYEKLSILPLNESDKLLLEEKKEDLYVELMLFKLKQDIKEQLGDTLAKLDDLEKLVNLDQTK